MPYTGARPPINETSDQLRSRIPGWGVDLDPADRPSVPRETVPSTEGRVPTGMPERQPERWPRERSIEHPHLTAVFGTSVPPRGISGAMRKYSYARYSEGRAAHWLLLLAADRVDVMESRVGSLLRLRPDNLLTQTGVLAEVKLNGVTARRGRRRADVQHQLLDPLVVAGPALLRAALVYRGVRAVRAYRHKHR